MRITNDQQIKDAANIVEIIGQHVKLKKQGADYKSLCPFHNEKSPSFSVSPAKNIYKCFGCGRSGDTVAFLMEHEKLNYPEALQYLATQYNLQIEREEKRIYTKPIERLEKLKPATIKWFEQRGISNNTTLRFKITEADEWMPKADKKVPTICFNYFRNEELVNIKFRAADKDFKLYKDAELIFYNLDALKGETVGIIVEGEPDVLACYEAGIFNVISVPNGANDKGVINLSYLDNSWAEIKHIEKWVLFTDNDEPGRRLKDELSIRLGKSICYTPTIIPDCKDANEILIKHGKNILKQITDFPNPVILPPTKTSSFPFHVFGPEIENSFREMAAEYSIPVDYFGLTALFTISALSGNMYKTDVSIQNIIFGMLVGPSGLGKSPAYNILCGDIVEPLEKKLFDNWKRAYKEWEDRKQDAKHAKPPQAFKEEKPHRRTRTAKGGTVEGIMAHSMTSPAGFGLYYDEGGKMLGSPNAFKKDNSSYDFWNELWNGKYFNELRADSELERFASQTRISVLMGMQTDRLRNYLNKEANDSGLTYRFLFVQADYIELNEYVDHFSERRKPCWEWVSLVQYLFDKGAYNYFKDDEPYKIPFTDTAALMYNQISGNLVEQSNKLRKSRIIGDADELLMSYESKLYSYFGRFMLALAIIENAKQPVIQEHHVDGALQIYKYFHDQAKAIFTKLNAESSTDLSENERTMLNALPDREFERSDIERVAKDLKMSDKFFDTAFRRKYKNGWIHRVSKGKYMKDN